MIPLGLVRSSSSPPGADSASSTFATTAAHSGVRSPDTTPAPPKVVSSRTDTIVERLVLILAGDLGLGALVDLAV